MKSFAMALNLKDDPRTIEVYKERHRAVWPEVLDGLRSIGISKMKIFLLGRRMFMYFEAGDDFDPATDFQRYQATERAREWEALMRGLQERVDEAAPGDWWAPMEEVFDLDWRPEAPRTG